jgi:adenylate kinase
MFDRAVAASHAGMIVFDGHLIIDTDVEIVEIPLEVIAATRPAVMVHVEAAPEAIAYRRCHDRTRTRPERTATVLAEQQHRSRDLCHRLAATLGIAAHIIQDGSAEALSRIWSQV